jgi:hypothetical protein
MRRGCLPLLVSVVFGVGVPFSVCPAAAQYSAQLEVERDENRTITRLELLNDRFYTLRAERSRSDGVDIDRMGLQLPGSILGLDGYTSLFLERQPSRTVYGTNFEMGRGVLALGGSIERAEEQFTGVYAKFRGGDVEIAAGGGSRDSEVVWHGAAYWKSERFSLVAGGAVGPGDVRYEHLAGTWHPEERGVDPGAWFSVERDGPRDYVIELNAAHRALFNHFTSWGAYNMDQWPHEKRFEALGDVMRYYRPSTRNQERSAGIGVIGGTYEVSGGSSSLLLDLRAFPFRIFGMPTSGTGPAGGVVTGPRDLGRELLQGVMVGLAPEVIGGGDVTWLGEVRLDPISLYAEVQTGAQTNAYFFLQYIARGWF